MLLINSIEDLDNMRNNLTEDYQLQRDLDFNEDASYDDPANKATYTTGSGWNPIDNFDGTLDGNGKTISNLFIDRPSKQWVGLFGHALENTVITNLGLLSANITGGIQTGILCGLQKGDTQESYVTGTVIALDYSGGLCGTTYLANIEKCYAIVTVTSSGNYIGGLIGLNNNSNITESYSEGDVTGVFGVGGLVGAHLSAYVSNCYSHANVSGTFSVGGLLGYSLDIVSVVQKCYSMGAVSGGGNLGGLIGDNGSPNTDYCYWDTDTSGQMTSDGGTGKTTVEMYNINTYTPEWDIEDEDDWNNEVWVIDNGNDYPYLGWTYTPPTPEVAKNIESTAKNTGILNSAQEIKFKSIAQNKEQLVSRKDEPVLYTKSQQLNNLISLITHNFKKSKKENTKGLKSSYEEK